MYLVETFWPLLKILQLIGIFPFKWTSNGNFEAINLLYTLTIYAALVSLLLVLQTFFVVDLTHSYDGDFVNVAILPMKKTTDIATFALGLICGLVLHITTHVKNLQLRTEFSQLLNNVKGQHKPPSNQCKIKTLAWLFCFLYLVYIVCMFFGLNGHLTKCCNLTIQKVLPMNLTSCGFMIYVASPTFVFLTLFADTSLHLQGWIEDYIRKIKASKGNFFKS